MHAPADSCQAACTAILFHGESVTRDVDASQRARRSAPPVPSMTTAERRGTATLASVYALRMLGLFIVLPVLALHVGSLPGGADPFLVGIALGVYGLTQALLQVPFGWASDRFGRRQAVVAGLVVFAAGSFVAALATSVPALIAGRALQGAGAISAVVMALVADLTRDEVRTRAMAVIGMSIGGTFALSLVAGPALAPWISVNGLFALTGVLALLAAAVFLRTLPALPPRATAAQPPAGAMARVLRDPILTRLNLGIFVLHALLTLLFLYVPPALRDAGLAPAQHWQVYLPVVLVAFGVIWPLVRRFDAPGHARPMLVGAIAALLAAQLVILLASASLVLLVLGLVVFFAAFSLLEAALPSLATRAAPAPLKGTATGVFTTAQFLGIFAGGALGGGVASRGGLTGLVVLVVIITLAWLFASLSMGLPVQRPHPTSKET